MIFHHLCHCLQWVLQAKHIHTMIICYHIHINLHLLHHILDMAILTIQHCQQGHFQIIRFQKQRLPLCHGFLKIWKKIWERKKVPLHSLKMHFLVRKLSCNISKIFLTKRWFKWEFSKLVGARHYEMLLQCTNNWYFFWVITQSISFFFTFIDFVDNSLQLCYIIELCCNKITGT